MDDKENTTSSLVANTGSDDSNDAHVEVKVPLKGGESGAEETSTVVVPKIRFPSCRLVLVAMGFFALFNCYTLRVNLSVAIVVMVNSTYLHELERADARNLTDSGSSNDPCGGVDSSSNLTDVEQPDGIFEWDMKTQTTILGAFFYGYAMTNIAGGMLAQKIGGKMLMLFGVFMTAFLSLLTPILTTLGGFWAIFFVRLIEGICEAVTIPAMATLLSAWAPPLERSKMSTFVYAGAPIGTVVGMPVSGILCQYFGWESVFYVLGAIAVIWAIMWFFLVHNSPSTHPRICPEERHYIEKILSEKENAGKFTHGTLRTPWLSFAKSLPFYALCVAHFTCTWGYYTLLTCLPQYFKHILHFDIKKNGLVSGGPYLVMWIMMLLGGLVADLLQKKKILSTTNVRKLANGVGFVVPGICLVATGYVDCNPALAVFLITIAVGFVGVAFAGFMVNHLDLAPPYAGTMMGITNTIGTVPGFIGPAIVGALTDKNQTRQAWRTVFYIALGVYLFGTIVYGIFGSGETQPWGKPPQEPEGDDVDEKINPEKESEKKSAT